MLHEIFGSITQNLLSVIAIIAVSAYSYYFIEFQLNLFPKISRSAYSILFNFIPLAASYWFIIKAFCAFRHNEFNFAFCIILCPIISIVCWNLFGNGIKERQEASGDICNNKVTAFVKNIMNYDFFAIFKMIGIAGAILGALFFVCAGFNVITGINTDKIGKIILYFLFGTLILMVAALLMAFVSALYADISKSVENKEALQKYYENTCKEYELLCIKHERLESENRYLLAQIESLESQIKEYEDKQKD